MPDEDLIRELDSYGDEYHKCRAAHLKRRSSKFRKVKKRILLELIDDKYTLPEFPCDPLDITVSGALFEITTFVVHGRDILWTGKGNERAPRKIWVFYESWEAGTRKKLYDR